MRFFKEPLLYFLLAGFGLFVLYYWINPEVDDNSIVINDETLMTFIQYRSKAFAPEVARKRWQAMNSLEKRQLLKDFVEEELLFREAEKLQLSEDDYIIKRRLVQKMDFILKSPEAESSKVDDETLKAFMQKNPEDYRVQAFITFTHVYFKAAEGAEAEAQQSLPALKELGFSEAGEFGQRFLYHRNYVERTRDYVAAHFGESFAQQVFEAELPGAGSNPWLGPIASKHGQHLLLVSKRQPAYQPELDEVRGRVLSDYRREQINLGKEKAVAKLLEKYPLIGDEQYLKLLSAGVEE